MSRIFRLIRYYEAIQRSGPDENGPSGQAENIQSDGDEVTRRSAGKSARRSFRTPSFMTFQSVLWLEAVRGKGSGKSLERREGGERGRGQISENATSVPVKGPLSGLQMGANICYWNFLFSRFVIYTLILYQSSTFMHKAKVKL